MVIDPEYKCDEINKDTHFNRWLDETGGQSCRQQKAGQPPRAACGGTECLLPWFRLAVERLFRDKPVLGYPVHSTLESTGKLMDSCGSIAAPMGAEREAVLVNICEGDRDHTNASKVGPRQSLAENPKQALQLLRVHLGFRQQRGL